MKDLLPNFIIAGTQKGGTTWLEHNLNLHPAIWTPKRQLHFFDKNFERGLEWYRAQFIHCGAGRVVGEKTTEYLDTLNCERTAQRIADTLPNVRLIFMLREPVQRAFSAVQHMVNSGLEALPDDPEALLRKDAERSEDRTFRYLERGLYARQLEIFFRHFPRDRLLILILEDDVKSRPGQTWRRVCDFLDIDPLPVSELSNAINRLRLSHSAIRLSRVFRRVPFARGAIRRLDAFLPLPEWRLPIPPGAAERTAPYFRDDVIKLEAMLGRKLASWRWDDQ